MSFTPARKQQRVRVTVCVVVSFCRFGRRPVFLFTWISMIFTRLAISLAPNYYVFLVGYVFAGALGIAMYMVTFVLSTCSDRTTREVFRPSAAVSRDGLLESCWCRRCRPGPQCSNNLS